MFVCQIYLTPHIKKHHCRSPLCVLNSDCKFLRRITVIGIYTPDVSVVAVIMKRPRGTHASFGIAVSCFTDSVYKDARSEILGFFVSLQVCNTYERIDGLVICGYIATDVVD